MTYTITFRETVKDITSLVGMKAAQLVSLYKLGFPVPEGFIVTVYGYRSLIESNHLIADIQEGMEANNVTLEQNAEKLRHLILDATMPSELRTAIEVQYKNLNSEFVAVRSSSTLEDNHGFSFAGQHTTLLNVRGACATVRATQKVMASLYNAEAMHYSNVRKLDHSQMLMATIVQQMVNAEKAGVMFTMNPVTHNAGEIVIEAALGLGESVVSGRLTPDRYHIDKSTGVIIKRKIGSKPWGFFREGEHTVQRPISYGNEPALSDAEVNELTNCGKQIEGAYGQPQDIEWAIDTQGIKILQARSILQKA